MSRFVLATILLVSCLQMTMAGERNLYKLLKQSVNSERETREQIAYENLEMLASSQFVRTVGSAWLSKIPRVEEALVTLYMTELAAKDACRWTSAERLTWNRKLNRIKKSVEKRVNVTDDSLGLSRLFRRGVIRQGAATQSVLINLETVTSAVYKSSWLDLVVVKFGGYLREKMLKKQQQLPSCTWTGADRREAVIQINAIVDRFVDQMNTEVFQIFQVLPTTQFKGADRFVDPWNQEIFATLFDPFYDEDDE